MGSDKRYISYVLNKPLLFWARIILGIIFISASVNKILHPAAFAGVIYNYQTLPDVLINLSAIFLPWLEIFLGLLLVFGLWLPGAVLVSNFLLMAFFGLLLFNMVRGLNIHCGCFGSSGGVNPNTTWYVIRDFIFLALAAYLFFGVLLSQDK